MELTDLDGVGNCRNRNNSPGQICTNCRCYVTHNSRCKDATESLAVPGIKTSMDACTSGWCERQIV